MGWGNNVSNYLIAIAAGCLQKTGGAFTLSAETDFGAAFGLKSLYYKTRATNVASTGAFRLANAETGIVWRNAANSGDLALTVNSSDQLTFNGIPIEETNLTNTHIWVGNASNQAVDVAMSGDVNIANTGSTTIQAGVVTGTKIASNTITNTNINSAAGIVYSKLSLTNGIVNADINSAAAIVYSKLSLTNSIVNADINSAAAIAYSKLNLALSIVNADISTSAAIAYSKLNLTGSIVNADISASAAIAYSKLALTASIVNADISATAAIAYSKLNLSNSIVNADINTAAGIVYSKLSLSNSIVNADINTSAAIAYSKLNLSGSIVNADISASAAIAITKIAPGTANQLIGANSGATANEYKTLNGTNNQITVSHAANSITLATPQNIDTGAAVRFGTLTLGGTLDASSILTLTSTTAGFLQPRMTSTQRNAISSPTDGLTVFDTSTNQIYLRAGGIWTPLSTGGGSGTVTNATQYQMAYYANSGSVISGLPNLVTDASGNINVTGQTSPNFYVSSTSVGGVQGRILASTNAALYIQTQTNHPVYFTTNNSTNILTLETNKSVTIPTGPLLNAAGLVSAPAYSFIADGTMGMYRAGSNILAFATSGTEAVRIDSAGKFGINFVPVVQLSVAGSGATSAPATTGTTPSTGTIVRLKANSNAVLDIGSNSSTYAWLQSYDQTGMNTNYPLALNPNGGNVIHGGNITFTASSVGIVGVTDASNATAGNVGEVMNSVSATISPVSSNTFFDVTSLNLTAGDWLISINGVATSGTTMTVARIGIGTASGSSSTGIVFGSNDSWWSGSFTSGQAVGLSVPSFRVSINATTTYYFKCALTYTGSPNIVGRITAVRIR